MREITQSERHPKTLPDFCNLGTSLRVLVIANVLGVAVALARAGSVAGWYAQMLTFSASFQPLLLSSLLALCGLKPLFRRLDYRNGVMLVFTVELALALLAFVIQRRWFDVAEDTLWLYLLGSGFFTALILLYFDFRSSALSPAFNEARLQALQARIRPHFLFNSLNAALSLIRSDPRRAERVLEDLADLFRVLMADNRELTPLSDEVELSRRYIEIEQLRLGERLKVAWHIDKMPGEALIPPLVIQPLLENAVYHGVERATEAGEISVHIYRNNNRVHIVLRNPYKVDGGHHGGNKMALANIRERLALHFDAEAELDCSVQADAYQVHIGLPYTMAKR